MITGISTSNFYPLPIELALCEVASSGADCCEIFFNTFSELKESFLQDMARSAKEQGLLISSIHPFTSIMEPFLFFSSYTRRLEDGLELYKRYFHAMNILGAKYLVFHGDMKMNTYPIRDSFDNLNLLCETAASFGVWIAHENVARCKGSSLEYLRQMADAVPNIRFTLDIKQAVRSNVDPFQIIETLGNKITHLHISDHGEAGDCLPPGMGNFDFNRLSDSLRHIGFDGAMLLELYCDGYKDKNQLFQSYEYFRSKL